MTLRVKVDPVHFQADNDFFTVLLPEINPGRHQIQLNYHSYDFNICGLTKFVLRNEDFDLQFALKVLHCRNKDTCHAGSITKFAQQSILRLGIN